MFIGNCNNILLSQAPSGPYYRKGISAEHHPVFFGGQSMRGVHGDVVIIFRVAVVHTSQPKKGEWNQLRS
jgi:hypothetical protein